MREYLNLDEPYYVQYGILVKRLVLGPSERTRRSSARPGEDCSQLRRAARQLLHANGGVDQAIKEAFPVTLSLVTVAADHLAAVAIPVGVLSAVKLAIACSTASPWSRPVGQALPVYYFGLLALYFLAYLPNSQGVRWTSSASRVELFPIGGYVDFSSRTRGRGCST